MVSIVVSIQRLCNKVIEKSDLVIQSKVRDAKRPPKVKSLNNLSISFFSFWFRIIFSLNYFFLFKLEIPRQNWYCSWDYGQQMDLGQWNQSTNIASNSSRIRKKKLFVIILLLFGTNISFQFSNQQNSQMCNRNAHYCGASNHTCFFDHFFFVFVFQIRLTSIAFN